MPTPPFKRRPPTSQKEELSNEEYSDISERVQNALNISTKVGSVVSVDSDLPVEFLNQRIPYKVRAAYAAYHKIVLAFDAVNHVHNLLGEQGGFDSVEREAVALLRSQLNHLVVKLAKKLQL